MGGFAYMSGSVRKAGRKDVPNTERKGPELLGFMYIPGTISAGWEVSKRSLYSLYKLPLLPYLEKISKQDTNPENI